MNDDELPVMEQNEREFSALLDLLRDERITSMVEVGVYQGGTLARFCNAFPGIPVIGIDPRPMIPAELRAKGLLTVVNGCSDDINVRQRARSYNGAEPFDFIFIDGDHTYDGVRNDWEWARHEARIVAFHDIHSTHTCPGVVKFWQELHADPTQWARAVTLAVEADAGRNGIGVVWTKSRG